MGELEIIHRRLRQQRLGAAPEAKGVYRFAKIDTVVVVL